MAQRTKAYLASPFTNLNKEVKYNAFIYAIQDLKELFDAITALQKSIANILTTVGGLDLAATLVIGNTTGGKDIVVSTGDQIIGQTDLLMGESTGDSYYYASTAYIFQQWYDGLGTGNTDFLLQGGGTQLFSHLSMDIQCDTGLYRFYEGTSFSGTLDFTNLSANRSYTMPNANGTLALTSDIGSGYTKSFLFM